MNPETQGHCSGEPNEPFEALAGIRVIDLGTLFAGPLIATILGDYGADVLKVEHPKRGDSLRSLGWQRDDVSLWWAFVSRNKKAMTLDLSKEAGQDLLKRLVSDADVLIESFRPDTLERWGIGPEVLLDINPGLVIVRTTGFGQDGPYRRLPGFGTLAESISGFAHINGWPDGPPTLPPFALGDGIAALTGTFAVMFALWWRDHAGNGRGQVIDLAIYEPLFWILGPQASVYDQLGVVQERSGNRAPFTAPRNTYVSRDGQWLGLSASTQSIAERVMRIIGREDIIQEPWFVDHTGRVAHAEQLDDMIGKWIGERTAKEVLASFAEMEAAIAPVYSIDQIVKDPQYIARETIVKVDHPVLGALQMQSVIPRMTKTPGRIQYPGRDLGEDNDEVLMSRLGLSEEDVNALRRDGVI